MVEPTALWVSPVADLAGVARHVLDVVDAGIPGWRIVVLCPPGPLARAVERHGGAVLAEPFGPDYGLAASLATLRRTVAKLRPALVHTHLAYADLVAALAPLGPNLRRVSTEHGIAPDAGLYHASKVQARTMARAHRLRQRRLDATIAVSHATARVLRDAWQPPESRPVVVIPNGIDPGPRPVRSPGFHVGAICRLAPEKGLDTLIDAFARLADRNDEARLTIAGDGPLADVLVRHAADAGIADRVAFPGYVDAAVQLAELDVVVQLSRWENSSYALLDAMAAGCGVVATDVGGNPEMLAADHLVVPGDVEGVVEAIEAQARDVAARPAVPVDWPTTTEMTARIAALYERVGA